MFVGLYDSDAKTFTMPQVGARLSIPASTDPLVCMLLAHELIKVDGKWRHYLSLDCSGIRHSVVLTRKQLFTIKQWRIP